MKSKVTVELDYENGNIPVIQILRVFPEPDEIHEDSRDRMIHSFCQRLGYVSDWAKVDFVQNHAPDGRTKHQRIFITPISPEELESQSMLMAERCGLRKMPEGKSDYAYTADFPRRHRIDLMVPAEKLIYHAIQEVEKLGADVNLTNAQILLVQAKDLISNYIDKK